MEMEPTMQSPLDPFVRSMPLFLLAVGFVAAVDLFGCTTQGVTTSDCATATVPAFAQLDALQKCTSCHSSTLTGDARSGAPSRINYDSYDAAVANIDHGLREIEEGAMPPSGAETLTADEETSLQLW